MDENNLNIFRETYGFGTKDEMLSELRAYTENPDDDNIKYKAKIKQVLLECPELLYAIDEPKFESELFNEDGTLNEDGEWDLYFGDNSNIRPYLYIPDLQTDMKTIICYQTMFIEEPRYNASMKYARTIFTIFVYGVNNIDKNTGIPRHDLIGSIIRDRFTWSNIFGTRTKIVSDKESTTDKNYVVRTLIFENVMPNAMVKTDKTGTGFINKKSLRDTKY